MRPAKWSDFAHPSLLLVALASLGFWGSIALKLLGVIGMGWPKLASLFIGLTLLLSVFIAAINVRRSA